MLASISWKEIWVSHRYKITTQIKECEYSVYLWSRVMIRFMWIITNKQYSQIYLFSLSYIRLKLPNLLDIRHYTKKTCFRKCCFYSISFFFFAQMPWSLSSQFSIFMVYKRRETNRCGQVIYLRNTNHVKSFEAGQISFKA